MDKQKNNRSRLYLAPDRSVYFGPLRPLLSPVCTAHCLLVSFQEPITIREPESQSFLTAHSILLPSGAQVNINTRGQALMLCYLDIYGRDMHRLRPTAGRTLRLSNGSYCVGSLQSEAPLISGARHIWMNGAGWQETRNWLLGCLSGSGGALNGPPVDPRVLQAIAIMQQRYRENIPIDALAKELSLSVPRLIQLFKRATGVPIRRFRLWMRVYQTTCLLFQGDSLTSAAVASGFCDGAHFSRAFKEVCGLSPSDVLPPRNQLEVQLVRSGADPQGSRSSTSECETV